MAVSGRSAAAQDTITQVIVAIRRVRREALEAAEIVAVTCHAHDYDDAGKRAIAWDDHQACGALVLALVGDATTIVRALRQATLNEILGAFVHVHLSVRKNFGSCMFVSFIACCPTLKE